MKNIKMKCLILSNQFRSMLIFWRTLIKTLQKNGINVVCCAPSGDKASEAELENLGARIINCDMSRKGLNPISDLIYYKRLKKIMACEKPEILFATTIKPVIYGCAAAKSLRIPAIFATITGLGYVFEADSIPKKMLMRLGSLMYRFALANIDGIFFQNQDDEKLFRENRIITEANKIFFANGTGVDVNRFAKTSLPPFPPLRFLLIARLLEAKGIRDYAAAASIIKSNYPETSFQILGVPENGRGGLPMEMISEWQQHGLIEYLGHAKDVRPYIKNSHVAVLPSWREGTPTALMEAMSMGRPCIATDVAGCREVVKNGVNGWLCKPKDPVSLADAMLKFIQQPATISNMGSKGRELAENEFEAGKVAAGIVETLLETLKNKS